MRKRLYGDDRSLPGSKGARRGIPLLAALLAALTLSAGEARAQAPACAPTQTVSAEADANGLYTTTISCADTSAAAGAADYRHLHYFQASSPGASVLTRDGSVPNNHWNNHVTLTIGSGVVFTADGYADMSVLNVDAAVSLATGSDKTIVVEEGAVINLERTPEFWSSSDPNRPTANAQYDPAWYPEWRDGLARLAGIHVGSQVAQGDVTVRHHGVINIDVELRGTYAGPPNTYGAFDGSAIRVFITDWDNSASRADRDILVELGPTGVIRHVEGTAGLSGIYASNYAEDGDVTINLAEGSLIDVSHAGGSGVWAWTLPSRGYASGELAGDTVVNARGVIRASVKHRMVSSNQGVGIVVFNAGEGRVHITSSGTIDTWQGNAIYGYPFGTTNTHHDDPATEEIESHLIDVTAGKVHTRGSTAIRALTGSPDDAWTIRVAKGALVRAELDAGPDAVGLENLGATGNRYVWPSGTYGWRGVDTDSDGENDALEPIINAIALGQRAGTPRRSEGVADRVLVDGTVEAIGGKEDVDAAVLLERGGVVMVGESGRISADSGLAIVGGVAPPAELPDDYEPTSSDLSVMVAGTVEGDIRTLDDGDLTVSVMEGGVVAGTIHDPVVPMTIAGSVGRLLLTNGGEVSLTSTGALTGVDGEVLRNAAGDLSVSVAGRVEGDLRNAGGDLTLTSAAGSVITGTVHDPATPLRVAGSVGRLLLTNGGEVTVASTGALTGVDGEAIRSEAGDLSVVVAGMASGRIRGVGGGLRATISGRVDGDVEGLGDGEHTVTVSTGGVVTGKIHVAASTVTVDGTVGEVRFDAGGTLSVGPNGRILSREGVAARNEGGDLVVTIRAAPGERPERAIARVGGRIEGAADGETTVTLVPADGEAVRLGEAGTRASVPSGAYDVGVSTSEGAVAFTSAIAPRAKVYEALPSVLLGMSAPLAHGERRGAPRAAGGGWARIEGARGDWRAGGSTAGAAYDVTRHGVRAGFDVSVDANLLLGFSVHHVRGSADVAGGGEIEVRGSGAGVSAAYAFGGGFYLEGQVETTFYAVDLESDLRGGLKTGASASGLAMGAELGKRMRFRRGTLTPRARLVRSSVSLDRFTDELGGRVSIRDADSLKGSLGLLAEAVRTSGEEEFALRGSVDVESVLSGEETVIEVGGDRLHAEAEKTRVLVGLGARWRKGDLSVGGEISAHGPGSDHESLGGRLSLGWRF